MDPRLAKYYSAELQYLREMGTEFAAQFPQIASRLALEPFECADPYVERLLEGVAFLTARVQLRLDAEFPRFTQQMLERVFPHYLRPVPSMGIVQLEPATGEESLVQGHLVPRGTAFRSGLARGQETRCEYRTAHDVTLWPLQVAEVSYLTALGDLAAKVPRARAALRVRLRTHPGVRFERLALDRLPLYLRGAGELPYRLHENLLAATVGVLVRPADRSATWQVSLGARSLSTRGFEDEDALLPYGPRSFQGYRLLQEYFAFAPRFLFVELSGLAPAVSRCAGTELDVYVLLDRVDSLLSGVLEPAHVAPFCSPVVNLVPRRADGFHLEPGRAEYHLVPDRAHPLDYEVWAVDGVTGLGTGSQETHFQPFYRHRDEANGSPAAYFTVRREPRLLSEAQRRNGPRTAYVGSEVFLSLVDGAEAPFSSDLKQALADTWCTNRDLPLLLTPGQGETDLTPKTSVPVRAVRFLMGPTAPRPAAGEGSLPWRLIGHLALNYLSLIDGNAEEGASALRELLALYGGDFDPSLRLQVEGLRSVQSAPVLRRVQGLGAGGFARGLEVTVLLDDGAFSGTGPFLLGAVLDRFFARYVSLNSFTETVVRTVNRGELIRWPARSGCRPLM
jgi:type VI secretion system protein ImpG